MTILVIGAGLVGSQVARVLVEQGETPVLMDTSAQTEAIGQVVALDAVHIIAAIFCGHCRLSRRSMTTV